MIDKGYIVIFEKDRLSVSFTTRLIKSRGANSGSKQQLFSKNCPQAYCLSMPLITLAFSFSLFLQLNVIMPKPQIQVMT